MQMCHHYVLHDITESSWISNCFFSAHYNTCLEFTTSPLSLLLAAVFRAGFCCSWSIWLLNSASSARAALCALEMLFICSVRTKQCIIVLPHCRQHRLKSATRRVNTYYLSVSGSHSLAVVISVWPLKAPLLHCSECFWPQLAPLLSASAGLQDPSKNKGRIMWQAHSLLF